MSAEITVEIKNSLRGQGFLSLKDGCHFSVRIVIPAGQMTKEFSTKITEISEKYGRGYFTLTQRLDVEIPFVKYEDLDLVREELTKSGLIVGGTGKRVRSIHTCKGTVCRFGLYDTEKMTKDFTERFYKKYYDIVLPNKFRIAIAGCKNSCPKPQMSDLGIIGRKLGLVGIFIGGMNGSTQITGKEIAGLYTLEEAGDVVERAINFYKEHGEMGERFPKMVERLGFELVEKELIKQI
ncbi:sulfite reductase subunit beta (hemoprotein) [Cetobacterium sp. 2A]|uniref:sulfite reductase subunit beta (hemoprotein) n=1 Tax=Cetobacterium sp. 2A TaxID=2754723 RepID=UPI00163C9CE6|nr:sulfite reductase subunit beta (hemoprotein) [Cetobacterium sp. 2A]MBC2857142.1 sulfite reductase subunit beta (hemoprotein) [Cetobacterium sp. 2A]